MLNDKKNDKRLCWNCEGNVSAHLEQCPYCGVDLAQPAAQGENSLFKGYGAAPFQHLHQDVPQPPYARGPTQNFAISEEEWNTTLHEEKETKVEEERILTPKREMIAFLLLFPGIVFFLFGLALAFFSNDGILTLQWNQSFAYFYFFGAVPMLFLGWRAFRR